jgi:hypothetical protein
VTAEIPTGADCGTRLPAARERVATIFRKRPASTAQAGLFIDDLHELLGAGDEAVAG